MISKTEKLYRLLRSRKIKPSKVILPLDRIFMFLRLTDRPICYYPYSKQVFILSAYWFVTFGSCMIILMHFLTRFFTGHSYLNSGRLDFNYFISLLIMHFIISLAFGFFTSFFGTRGVVRKLGLPAWEELAHKSVDEKH